ncbi:hypothetical protein PISL3812_04815 [Talaromyces islandicus]|uniref:Methyltransferase domain-containing protein n=1 Tax=Talaromyces islandicus TaxID=28573 RepID=A0A0U1LWL2_TALIS|nr:hypothetical protein PISL3812_04815 [Talaromyces islandicus]
MQIFLGLAFIVPPLLLSTYFKSSDKMSDILEANKRHFNKESHKYEIDFEEHIRMLCEETERRRLWISSKWSDTPEGNGQEVKLLDYACGPGYMSRLLAPYVTKAVGIDASEGMVSEYNKKMQEAGIPPEKMSARVGNILGDTFSEDFKGPEYQDFDVALIGNALHHFSDPLLSMKRVVDRLREGGVLWVIDVLDQPHARHEHEKLSPETKASIHTHGFKVDQVKNLFAQAGAGADVKIEVIDKTFEIKTPDHNFKRTVFFARGQKL